MDTYKAFMSFMSCGDMKKKWNILDDFGVLILGYWFTEHNIFPILNNDFKLHTLLWPIDFSITILLWAYLFCF